jgi:hypothetical protein
MRYRTTHLFGRLLGLESLSQLSRLDDLGADAEQIRAPRPLAGRYKFAGVRKPVTVTSYVTPSTVQGPVQITRSLLVNPFKPRTNPKAGSPFSVPSKLLATRMLVESRTNATALLFVLVPGSTVTVCPSEQLSTMSGNTLWLGSPEATPVKHSAAAETARSVSARVTISLPLRHGKSGRLAPENQSQLASRRDYR